MASLQWIETHARNAVKRAKERVGAGWPLLGPELQEALVCRQIVFQLLGQDDSLLQTPIETWVKLARTALESFAAEGHV